VRGADFKDEAVSPGGNPRAEALRDEAVVSFGRHVVAVVDLNVGLW
jgi:hypothetical protein